MRSTLSSHLSMRRNSYKVAPPRTSLILFCSVFVFLSVFVQVGKTVKRENWKTCEQSGFCRRNRALADEAAAAGSAWTSPYELDAGTVVLVEGQLKGTIWKTVPGNDGRIELPLVISFMESGVARIQIDEARRQKGEIELRGDSKARKERYNEAGKWALVGEPTLNENVILENAEDYSKVLNGPHEIIINHKPFGIRFLRDGETHVVFNERNLMNIEHWRPKPEQKEGEEAPKDMGEWEETFGGNTDSKPRGMFN